MPASRPEPRWSIPKWVLEVWIWVTVPAAYLDYSGCPLDALNGACTAFSNTLGWLLFTMVPGETLLLFLGLGAKLPAALFGSIGVAALCHLLARRFLPSRVGVGMLAVIYVGIFGLTASVVIAATSMLLGALPWQGLIAMVKLHL